MKPKVIKDPQGVVLIIGPFNYPLVSWFLSEFGDGIGLLTIMGLSNDFSGA